jgi:hypothetical protein
MSRSFAAGPGPYPSTEMLQGALGLSTPQPVRRDFNLAERVFFYSRVCIIQNFFLFS